MLGREKEKEKGMRFWLQRMEKMTEVKVDKRDRESESAYGLLAHGKFRSCQHSP